MLNEVPSCYFYRCCSSVQFYRTVNEGGSHQKIEVVFVSADKDERAFQDHVKHMPWLVIDFNDPLRTILLRHFRVSVSAPFTTL